MQQASIWKQTEQSPDDNRNFSELVNDLMKKKGWSAKYLAERSNLSKTTISRIQRNSNDKGQTYSPTANIVTAIAVAFGVGRNGWEQLMFAAFPETKVWFKALDCHYSIDKTNELLFDDGCPLLGNSKSE